MNGMIGYKSTKTAVVGLSEQAACAVAEFGMFMAQSPMVFFLIFVLW